MGAELTMTHLPEEVAKRLAGHVDERFVIPGLDIDLFLRGQRIVEQGFDAVGTAQCRYRAGFTVLEQFSYLFFGGPARRRS